MEELLQRTLGVDSLPTAVAREIMDRSAGNPLFAMEFALAMRDEGLVQIVDGRCELKVSLDLIDFPPSVEALITSRFDRLPPASLLLLKVAAVCGSEFSVEAVKRMLSRSDIDGNGAAGAAIGIPADAIEPTLETLTSSEADMLRRMSGAGRDARGGAGRGARSTLAPRRAIAEPNTPKRRPAAAAGADDVNGSSGGGAAGGGDYRFKHRYLQEVAYDLTAEELKERLHYAAALYFEEQRLAAMAAAERERREEEAAEEPRRGGARATQAAAAAAAATARGVGETHLEALVHHWRRAGPSPHAQEKAVHYLTLLGDRALDNFSLVESEELHTAALNIVDAEAAAAQGGGGAVRAQRGPLLRRIARRHFLQGQHKAAEARLSET